MIISFPFAFGGGEESRKEGRKQKLIVGIVNALCS